MVIGGLSGTVWPGDNAALLRCWWSCHTATDEVHFLLELQPLGSAESAEVFQESQSLVLGFWGLWVLDMILLRE
jgi:hypothetical protein